jgi:hypothetical protein
MRKLFPFFMFLIAATVAKAQNPTATDTASLVEYKGVYKFPPGSVTESVEITIQNGALFGSSSAGSATFVRVNKDTFSLPEHDGTAYFSRNANKKVNHIHIEIGDTILDGDKEGVPNSVAWRMRKRLPVSVK